ncbi:MAG: pilus assembly protein TadG-related protein, partial [Planctomycetaceae bacterium]
SGKTLVLFVLLLPVLLSFAGLVIDGSLILGEHREVRHLADAAAMAAAQERLLGGTAVDELAAVNRVLELNNASDVEVDIHSIPISGPYAGKSDYVEVELTRTFRPHLFNLFGDQTIHVHAVAGIADATDHPAIVLLGSNPVPLALPAIGTIVPALPAQQAALEMTGAGEFHVHNAIVVNSTWGGVDGKGDPSGIGPGPPWAVARIGTGKLESKYVYTSGGVDDLKNYDNVSGSNDERILANRRPVPDPLKNLPYPPYGPLTPERGSLLFDGNSPTTTILQPGFYDWIQINGGNVTFTPGTYIIKGANPETGIGLHVTGGDVTARGVMFYFDWTLWPGWGGVQPVTQPSVLIDLGSGTHEFTGLDDSISVFNAMTFFQHRNDRRPVILVNKKGVANRFEGAVYAKSAPIVLIGGGDCDAVFVADSMRVVLDTTSDDLRMHPDKKSNHMHLTPARDVFLVQ